MPLDQVVISHTDRWLRLGCRCEVLADAIEHERLDLGGGHPGDAAGLCLPLLQNRMGDIVAVANSELVGVGRAHPAAAVVEDAAGQDGGRALQPDLPVDGVGGEFFLHGLEQGAIEDRLMLPAMDLAAIDHLADVEPVLEQIGEGAHSEPDASDDPAVRTAPRLGPDAAPVEILHESPHRAELEIAGEDGAHGLGLLGYDHELLVDAGIAERDWTPDPDALALGS